MCIQTILRHLWLNETLADAVNSVRAHHQLAPMRVDVEANIEPAIRDGLLAIGHVLREAPSGDGFAAVTAISRNMETGEIYGAADYRRKGSVSIF